MSSVFIASVSKDVCLINVVTWCISIRTYDGLVVTYTLPLSRRFIKHKICSIRDRCFDCNTLPQQPYIIKLQKVGGLHGILKTA